MLSFSSRVVSFNNVLFTWLKQHRAMLYKNSLILRRQGCCTTTFLILLPLFGLIFLVIASHINNELSNSNTNNCNYFPVQDPIVSNPLYSVPFGKCISLDSNGNQIDDSNCISILYYPESGQTDSIMFTMANELNLEFGSDVVGLPSSSSIEDYITSNLGLVDVAIEFLNHSYTQTILYENQINYQIYFNCTPYYVTPDDISNLNVFSHLFSWQINDLKSLDSFYQRIQTLQFYLEKSIADSIAANVVKQFPVNNFARVGEGNDQSVDKENNIMFRVFSGPLTQFQYQHQINDTANCPSVPDYNNNVAIEHGSIFAVTISASIIMLILIPMVVEEKQTKMLGALRINGLHDSSYWAAWITAFIALSFIAAMICSIGCAISNLQTYSHTDFGIYFIMNWCFLMCMSALALFIASLFNQPKWINFISLIIFAFAVVSGIIWPGNQQIYSIYSSHSAPASFIFLSLLPWVPTAKILADIYQHSTFQLVVNQTALNAVLQDSTSNFIYPSAKSIGYEFQRSYSWSQIYDPQIVASTDYCTVDDKNCCEIYELHGTTACIIGESTSTTFGVLVFVTFFYSFLAWYFANIFTPELGGNKSFYFFLTRQFWGLNDNRHKAASIGDHIRAEQLKSESDGSIRTVKLSKAFKNTSAVKEISIQMEKNQVFVLLGHNGAGKTTLINMLTGLLAPTFGEGFVCGLNIRHDTEKLTSILGVCDQQNILYENLTCYEHLKIFALLRNINSPDLDSVIYESLREVHLDDAGNKRVDQLSGGMKRRLMIAIALISQPKVLFLDEPTTGMDPLNRSQVWDSIQKIKRNRVVVLTTHSMEEAESLGDQIAMISFGRLRALGSSLFLKQHYGRGYQLQLLVNQNQINLFSKIIQDYLIGAELLGTEGGNITVSLKREAVRGLPQFFRYIQQHNNMNKIMNSTTDLLELKEWRISNSTLEEVFLRLCNYEKGINVKLTNEDEDRPGVDSEEIKKCVLCNMRTCETVTLFTADGVPVTANNLVCAICSIQAKQEKEKKLQEEKEAHVDIESDSKPLVLTLEDSDPSASDNKMTSESIDPMIELTNFGLNNATPANNIKTDDLSEIFASMRNERFTKFNQIRAVFLKNCSLIRQEKMAWISRIVVFIGLIITLIVITLSAPGIYSRQRAGEFSVCPSGMLFSVVGTAVPGGCDLASIQKHLFGNGESSQTINLDAQYLPPFGPPSIVPLFYFESSSPVLISSVYFMNSNITNETPFDLFDLGLGSQNLLFDIIIEPSFPILQASFSPTQFTNVGDNPFGATDLNSLIFAYQNDLYSLQYPPYIDVCEHQVPPGTVVLNTSDMAVALAERTYPDLGIQFIHTFLGHLDEFNTYQPGKFAYNFEFFFSSCPGCVPITSIEDVNSNTEPLTGTCQTPLPCPYRYLNYPFIILPSMIHSLSNAYLWTTLRSVSNMTNLFGSLSALTNTSVNNFIQNAAAPRIIASIHPLPFIFFATATIPAITRIAEVTIISFATFLLFPWFVDRIIYERENQLFYMQRLNGLKPSMYWLGNYCFDSCILWLWAILILVIGYSVNLVGFQHTSVALYILIFLIWNHVQLCLAILMAGFFNRQRFASIVCHFLVIFLSLYAAAMEAFIVVDEYPSGLLYFPPFAYIRLISLMVNYSGNNKASDVGPDRGKGPTAFNDTIIILFFIGSASGIIGLYLNSALFE